MNEKPEEINEKLDKILSDLPKKESSQIKVVELLENLLIPILLGVLAFITSDAGNKISKSQLELAKSQENRQVEESKSNLQIKYIELFYSDITSGEIQKQKNALSLLTLISTNQADPLLKWASTFVKPEAKGQIDIARNEINSRIVSILSNYEIMIYFLENNQDLLKSAQEIKQKLVDYGLTENQVRLEKKDDSFFQNLGYPTGYEIRYDQGIEDKEAELLESILTGALPSKQFIKRGIGSGTKNSISIFFVK